MPADPRTVPPFPPSPARPPSEAPRPTSRPIRLDEELTKGFAARLIRRKAGQLVTRDRIGQSDREDFEQDLKLDLLQRLAKFDPALGRWNAFVCTVTEHYVATFLQRQRAQKRGAGQTLVSLSRILSSPCGPQVESGRGIPSRLSEPVSHYQIQSIELALDVETILVRLPDDLQGLCRRLETDTVRETARRAGIPRTTLHDRLAKLRKTFIAAGFWEFLREPTVISSRFPVGS